MTEVKTARRVVNKDQEQCVADLRRNGQGFTADRVEALSEVAFAIFKRDLLARFAADGRLSAWHGRNDESQVGEADAPNSEGSCSHAQ